MLQIKTFHHNDPQHIDDLVNQFLATLTSEAVKDIDVRESGFAVVTYEVKDTWSDMICADCSYWDDTGSADAVIGLCQECGGRKRFNCKACQKFKDIRG